MQTKRGASLISGRDSLSRWLLRGRLVRIVIGIALLDATTKSLALAYLGREKHPILGKLLSFHLVYNSGAAFSLAPNRTTLLSAFSLITAALIVVRARTFTSPRWIAAAGLVLGGISGNLIDRVIRAPGALAGQVIDWIELPHWPTFNIADSSIVVGAVLAAFLVLREIPTTESKSDLDDGTYKGDEHE